MKRYIRTSFDIEDLKQAQLEIILNSNPMLDDYHVGVRDIDDILTFEEAWKDPDSWDPDFELEDAKKCMSSGSITVYSSYPIKQGVFVSPSKMEAAQYAGGHEYKLYSKKVKLTDVAWIDATQGQYAKVV